MIKQKNETCGACGGNGYVRVQQGIGPEPKSVHVTCLRCVGHGFFYEHGCGVTYTLEHFKGLEFGYEEFWNALDRPVMSPRIEYRYCVCGSIIGIGTDREGNWIPEKDWLLAHGRRNTRKLTNIKLESVSLVSRCPYCGSDDWDNEVKKPDGTMCEHPTKFGRTAGLGVAGRVRADDD